MSGIALLLESHISLFAFVGHENNQKLCKIPDSIINKHMTTVGKI